MLLKLLLAVLRHHVHHVHQGGEGLPLLAGGASRKGAFLLIAEAAEHIAGVAGDVLGTVRGLRRTAQGKHRLLDLGALKETLRAAQLVRNVGGSQRRLNRRRLCVRAEQHRNLRRRHAVLLNQVADVLGNACRLLLIVGIAEPLHIHAGAALRHQLQRRRPRMRARIRMRTTRRQQTVRQLHHLRMGTVIAGQLHRVRATVPARKIQQVTAGRAGKRVNRLGGVTHHANILAATQPHIQQTLLQRGHVLVLIHHKMAVLVADGRGELLILLQHGDGQQQYVLKIDEVTLILQILIRLENTLHILRGNRRGQLLLTQTLHDGVRGEQLNLRPLNQRRQITQQGTVRADAQTVRRLRNERCLILHDGRERTTHHLRPEIRQLTQRRRVEGTRLHTVRTQLMQAGTHLLRRTQGEGQGEHARALVATDRNTVGDAVRNRAGLTGTRTRQHAHGAVQLGGDRTLIRVKPGENIVCGDHMLRLLRCGGHNAPSVRRAVRAGGVRSRGHTDMCVCGHARR